jgi:hypothetical protein
MAIEKNEGENVRVEFAANAFHNELHAEQMAEKNMSPEAQRFSDMLAENERMLAQIKDHAMRVADSVSTSLMQLPESVQRDFINSIAKYDDSNDLVYARVRKNYENRNNA